MPYPPEIKILILQKVQRSLAEGYTFRAAIWNFSKIHCSNQSSGYTFLQCCLHVYQSQSLSHPWECSKERNRWQLGFRWLYNADSESCNAEDFLRKKPCCR